MEPWDRLIRAAEIRAPETVRLLRRLRDVGCELERQASGKWRIRYGKAVASGRVTEAEMRDQWLRPNADKLRAALALLEEPEQQSATEPPSASGAEGQAQGEPSNTSGLDPRPDLAADHGTWEIVLAEARARNRVIGTFTAPDGTTHPMRLEALFHALRVFGVTVETRTGRAVPYLRLIWEPLCSPYLDEDGRWTQWMTKEAFRAWVLDPYRDAISAHLRHVMEVISHAHTQAAA